MTTCFFATDLHGITERYDKLFHRIREGRPHAVFLGGDLLSPVSFAPDASGHDTLVQDYLVPSFRETRAALGKEYPDVFVILGNDDLGYVEKDFLTAEAEGLWHYMHAKKQPWRDYTIYGLCYVPPTPFLMKDWERYDVSRYVPPGAASPEEGYRTLPVEENHIKWTTIHEELHRLVGQDPLDRALFLFHIPPYETPLDRAALDGKRYEDVALDVHVGSIAIRRFIEERQPLLTMHGHVHESARLTGEWKIQVGRTVCFNGAHDGPELALVRFDPACPVKAARELL
jgi:Icc-related predicted phosphoesterase